MGARGGGVAVFTEDSYGAEFVRRLLERPGLSGRAGYCRRLAGVCSSKSVRQLKAAALDYEKVVVLVDGDWDPENVRKRMNEHLENLRGELGSKVRVIVVESEIEEWVCESLGLRYRGLKPSQVLSDHLRREKRCEYEKYMLPSLAGYVNPEKLASNSSFNSFIRSIRDD